MIVFFLLLIHLCVSFFTFFMTFLCWIVDPKGFVYNLLYRYSHFKKSFWVMIVVGLTIFLNPLLYGVSEF